MWNPAKILSEPKSAAGSQARALSLWLAGLALAVFLGDIAAPLGTGVGAGYLAVIFATLWLAERYTWTMAGLCTALALAKLGIPHFETSFELIRDRGFAVLFIWTIAGIGIWQKRLGRSQALAQREAASALEANAALKAALARMETAEAQLRRGQRLLDTVATMARIGGWELDLATMTPIWSQEVYRIHETDPSTPLDLATMLEFYAPEARPLMQKALENAIEHGMSFDHTVPFITATGQKRWLRAIGVAERTNGVTTRLSGAFQDVTEQHETQIRFARASHSSSEGHWDYDFGTETVWCSATHEELLGLPPRDTRIPADEFRARAHPEDQARIATAFQEHISTGHPFDIDLRMRTAGGEWRWFRTRGAVERDELGRLTSFAGSLIDVHDERLAQEELHRVRGRLDRAVHGTQDGLWELDIATDTMWMSPRFCELLGYDESELNASHELTMARPSLTAKIHPDDLPRLEEVTQAHFEQDAPYDVEVRMRARGGEYRWYRIRGKVERDTSGRPLKLSGSTQDITPRKLAEAARVEAEQRLERAIRGSSDAFFEHVVGEDHIWYSPRMGEMLGYAPGEPLPRMLASLMPPEDCARAETAMRRHFEEGAPYDVTFRLPTRSGDYRWFRARGRCERDAARKPTRFSGSIQDITTQREAEAALVSAKEAAAAANRAKSEFLANMSHEIRTPMNGVLGMTELLLDTALQPVQREFAETIHTSATSLLAVLNDILDFSKIEAGKLEIEQVEMDVRECMESVGAMLAVQAASKNLELIVDVDPSIPARARGDPHRLRQILTNLVGNAVKFTQRGEIVVSARLAAVESERALLHFEVRDTGPGMSAEVLRRLFRPFVQADASTTRHYGGTGLGLSIVNRLVELMGGEISVASELGAGSTFTFTLPCPLAAGGVSPAAAASRSARERVLGLAAAKGPRYRGRVLVVEDNSVNQQVTRRFLERLGCEVELAENGLRAVECCARSAYDLILMDVQMPVMDGLAATREIRRHEAAEGRRVPIIALTASAMTDELARCIAAGMDGLLTKPLEPARLAEILDQSGLGGGHPGTALAGISAKLSTAAIDLTRLRAIAGEDRDFVQELCQTFLSSSGRIVDELRSSLAAGDRARLGMLAHKLKGGSGSVCAQRVGDLAAVLERGSAARAAAELEELVDQIEAALRECAGFIEAQVA